MLHMGFGDVAWSNVTTFLISLPSLNLRVSERIDACFVPNYEYLAELFVVNWFVRTPLLSFMISGAKFRSACRTTPRPNLQSPLPYILAVSVFKLYLSSSNRPFKMLHRTNRLLRASPLNSKVSRVTCDQNHKWPLSLYHNNFGIGVKLDQSSGGTQIFNKLRAQYGQFLRPWESLRMFKGFKTKYLATSQKTLVEVAS